MFPTAVSNPEKNSKMASAKLTWLILQWCIGWPITLFTVSGEMIGWLNHFSPTLNIPKENILQIAEPYQSIVTTLAIIFLITKIAISYELWREKHIGNDERKYKLRKRHLKDLQSEMNEEEI